VRQLEAKAVSEQWEHRGGLGTSGKERRTRRGNLSSPFGLGPAGSHIAPALERQSHEANHPLSHHHPL